VKRVALVVGHDKRKKGVRLKGGYYEWDYNSKLVNEIFDILQKTPLKDSVAIFYRNPDIIGYSNKMRELHYNIEHTLQPHLAIEFHINGSNKRGVNGHEVLYYYKSKAGKELATNLNNIFNKLLQNRDRGIKQKTKTDRGGGFLHRGSYPCLITEPFFAQNINRYDIGTQGYQNLLGAYLEFIIDFIES